MLVMELSPEERQRIYLEEKARLEAQEALQRERDEEQKIIQGMQAKQNETQARGFVGLFSVVILSLALWYGVQSAKAPARSEPKRPSVTKADAWTMATRFVERRLKAPGTADFPWCSDQYITDLGNGAYRVVAFVDSENGFGAKIRTRFVCTVKHVGGDNWILKGIRFSDW
jgi:hypothetical protein